MSLRNIGPCSVCKGDVVDVSAWYDPTTGETAHNGCKTMAKPLPVEGHVPRALLEPLRGKRVLITGPNGFVGRWMSETLKHANVGAHTFHLGRGQWSYASHIPAFDYCVHCTSEGDGVGSIIERAKRCGGRVLYPSSGAVYGTAMRLNEKSWEVAKYLGEQRPFKEDDPYRPFGKYGEDKVRHERLCLESGLATVARLFTFVGPGLRRHVGREFLEADPIKVKDDGAVRSFMYAGDMARWLWTILLKGHVWRCYNVGSGEPATVMSLAKECSHARGVKVEIDHQAEQVGTHYVPDTTRAETELGLRCKVGLVEAIGRTLAWRQS